MKNPKVETPARDLAVRPNHSPPGANGSRRARIIQSLVSPATCWAGLAILTLAAVLFVATCCAPDLSRIASASPGSGLVGWGCLPGITRDWYVSHGQWRADARTVLAALRFVLSPDLDNWSPSVVPPPARFLSATTNSGRNMPNA